jgi:hypothetical protein
VIRVYDEAGNAIETHEHTGDLKEREAFYVPWARFSRATICHSRLPEPKLSLCRMKPHFAEGS